MRTTAGSEYKLVDEVLKHKQDVNTLHCISRYFYAGYQKDVNLEIINRDDKIYNYYASTDDKKRNENIEQFSEATEETEWFSESCDQNNSQDSGINLQISQEFLDKTQNSQTFEDGGEDLDTNLSSSQLNDSDERIFVEPFFNITPREMPKSPHGVIEEEFKRNPWVMLVATIFLTKTTAKVAKPFMKKFFDHYPTPLHVLDSEPSHLEEYFETLGLRKRGTMIWKLSYQFISGKWRRASDLCGIGKYGEDAYRLFCLGHCDIEPTDRYLRLYLDWLKLQTDHAKSWGVVDCETVITDPVEKYYRISLR